jgi:hypothetical protein
VGKIRVLESQRRERQHEAEPHRPLGLMVHWVIQAHLAVNFFR